MTHMAIRVIRPGTRRRLRPAVAACLAAIVAGSPSSLAVAAQANPGDVDALRGVTTGKVVFDINTTNPKTLASYLGVIEKTYDDLSRQQVTPDIILAVRGVAVSFVSTDRERFDQAERQSLDEVADSISRLLRRGARIESCAIAMQAHEVDPDTLIKGVKTVGNTFVSLTGYQAQGYGVIPIY